MKVPNKKVLKCLWERKFTDIGLFRSATLPQVIVEVMEVVEIGLKRPDNPPKVILEAVEIVQVLADTLPLIMLCN